MAALALATLLLVVYTYAGYPLLIAVWAKLAPWPALGRDDFEPTVSICLSVYNGEAHLAAKVRNLQELDYPAEKLELLIFSDGSTDGTEKVVRGFPALNPRIRLLSSPVRLGKPSASQPPFCEGRGDGVAPL